jgi:hypothetical protein
VRDIIEANRCLGLATADRAGLPWSSPLYFAHIDFVEFFWVSSPDVTHSCNVAVRPEVVIVVFDSQVAIGARYDARRYLSNQGAERTAHTARRYPIAFRPRGRP